MRAEPWEGLARGGRSLALSSGSLLGEGADEAFDSLSLLHSALREELAPAAPSCARVALQHLLELLDVADGGAESLHFAEALVRQLSGQVVSRRAYPSFTQRTRCARARCACGGRRARRRRPAVGQVGPPQAPPPLPSARSQPAGSRLGDSEGVPQREAWQGPRHAQRHLAQVIRQGQQSGLWTFLHHSPKRKPITPEVNLPAEDD